jgi:DNA-binding MarR family transcriptional regulator
MQPATTWPAEDASGQDASGAAKDAVTVPVQAKVESTRGAALVEILWDVTVASVGSAAADLTMRQLAIFLQVYTVPTPQTVRSLATRLGIPKPGVTRSIDRLQELGYVCRTWDPLDRRSVLLGRTNAGAVAFRQWQGWLAQAGAERDGASLAASGSGP